MKFAKFICILNYYFCYDRNLVYFPIFQVSKTGSNMPTNYREARIVSPFIDYGFAPYLKWREICGVKSEPLLVTAKKLREEIEELELAIKQPQGRFAVLGEFADVANFAVSVGDGIGVVPSTVSSNGRGISTFDELHYLASERISQHRVVRPIELLPALYTAAENVMELAKQGCQDQSPYSNPLHELLLGSAMGAHLLAANIGDVVYAKHLRNVNVKYTYSDMEHLMKVSGKPLAQALAFLAGRYKTFKRAHFDLHGTSLDDWLLKQYGIR